MAKKYYVVFNGHNTGIYDNWPETVLQVNGFSHAAYQGYDSWEAARMAYLHFFKLNDLPTTIHLPTEFRPTSSHVKQDDADNVNRYMAIELEQTRKELEQTRMELEDTRMELERSRELNRLSLQEVNNLREQLISGIGNVNLD